MLLQFSKQFRKSDQGDPVDAKIGPRGTPQRVRKTSRKQNTLPDESGKQLAPKYELKYNFGVYFGLYSSLLSHINVW